MNRERFRDSAGKSALISLSIISLTLLICAGMRPLHAAQHTTTSAATAKRIAAITPFTLRTQFHDYDPKDIGMSHLIRLIARRSDGATAMLMYRPGESAAKASIRSIFFPDGRQIDVLDEAHALTNWPKDARLAAARNRDFANAPRECLHTHGEHVAGHAVLGGVGVLIVKEFPKGSSGFTWWRTPELGCESLQDTYTQVRADGSFHLARETKFVSVQLGAPDAALFAVPKTYESVKPSQLMQAWAKRAGQKWDAGLQEQASRDDAQYAHLQQAAKSNH